MFLRALQAPPLGACNCFLPHLQQILVTFDNGVPARRTGSAAHGMRLLLTATKAGCQTGADGRRQPGGLHRISVVYPDRKNDT